MENVERLLASHLMEIEAVLLRPSEPFQWASGWFSPIYCDNRRLLSYPEIRSKVVSWMAEKVESLYPEAELIAGVATGAIAHGVLVAERLSKPFIYVRPKPKDHGTGSQIEGILHKRAKVVIIEDLISTGMSSLAAAKALKEAGAEVLGMTAIFTYGFEKAEKSFIQAGIKLDTLSNYESLLGVAKETGYIKETEYKILQDWRLAPDLWNKK